VGLAEGRVEGLFVIMPFLNCFYCDYSILAYVGTVVADCGGLEMEYERYKCAACGEEFDVLIEE
jgi:DNA-directed RNA polymerase subunit RPC12/RpoP